MMEILINDLLDHAKLENQSFSFNYDFFDLPSTLEEAFTILAHSASERKIGLRASIDSESNLKYIRAILGDKRRYLQVLLNFLSNSLKFTNEGGWVTISIKIISMQKIEARRHQRDDSFEADYKSASKYSINSICFL